MFAAGVSVSKRGPQDNEQRRLLAFVRSAYSDRELEGKVRV